MGKKITLTLIFLLSWTSSRASYIANRDFLSTSQGARANGMGEAYVAVADDSSGVYWNPAGLTQMTSDEVSTSYANRFDGLAREAQVHYSHRGVKGMWGFGYTGSYINDIPVTPSLTEDDLSAIQTGAFGETDHAEKTVSDHALLFAYSRPVVPDSPHALGTTVKLIYRDMLGMVHGYGTAVDLGYLYTPRSGTYRLGANLQNAASLMSYTGTIDNLGVRATATESYIPNLKAGVAFLPPWRVLNGKMLLAFDVNMLTSFDVEDYRAGIEYAFGEVVSLRAGKIFSRQEDSSQDYTLGVGIRLKKIILDFSFLSTDLGQTTRGTIGYRIGQDYYTPTRY